MKIGNRIFPYPVINSQQEWSEFNDDSTFALKITYDDNGCILRDKNRIFLKDVHFELTDKDLLNLYDEGKVKCAAVIESSSSVFRETREIFKEPKDLEIEIDDLKGNVYISSYCYATENIENYVCDSFKPEYKDYVFDIEKYDILAVDDGIKANFDREFSEDNKVSSIFQIIEEEGAKTMHYDKEEDRIVIYIPTKHFGDYNSLKNKPEFNNIFFSMIGVPVLASCILEIQKEDHGDIEEICDDFHWFKSVISSYKKETNKELTLEELNNNQALVIAQLVINNASLNGMSDFSKLAIDGLNNGGAEDE